MADGRIIIDTEIDSSGAEKDLKGLNNNLSGLAKKGLAVFTGAIASAGTAIGGLAGIATKYNSQMEDYFANFTVLLGSAEKATKHVEDLKKFAADTPFEMPGIADASKQLLSFGFEVDEILPTLQTLGDISLGNQARFDGLALVFSQVRSQGKLMGNDLYQFINAGFNPLQAIAEKTGKTMAELKDEMSEGKITYEMVADAMRSATSAGGKFYQGMAVASQTLSGQWSTLKDDTMSLLGDAFMPFSNILKDVVMPALQDIVKQMEEAFADPNVQNSISNIASGLGEFAIKIGELISDLLPKLIEGFSWMLDHSNEITAGIVGIGTALMVLNVANIILGLVKAFRKYKEVTEGATIAQWLLNAAQAANPIGLIVAAIAGLIAGLVVLWNTNESFRNAITTAWNAIKKVGLSVWEWLVKFFTVDIPNAWQAMMNWFGSVGDWFVEIWENIKKGFIDGWNSIVSFFTESIPAWWEGVKQAFVDGWNAITNFFTETIPALMGKVGEWFSELPYRIGYALGYAYATVIKWGVDTWNSFVETCINIYTSVTEWFSQLPGKIEEFVTNAYNNVVEWGTNTWNNFVETCTNIYNSVTEWFSKLPGVVWNWLVNTYNNVVEWGTDMYNKAIESAKNFIDGVISWISQLPEKISVWLRQTIDKLINFASDAYSKAKEAGKNIVDGIVNTISNLPSQIYGIGVNIVEGLWNGITSMGTWIRNKVSSFFTGIVDGAKAALGIHSPSRVFRDQVGKYMAQGVGVGFEDETDNVRKSMENDLSDLVAKMSATVDYETAMTTARVVTYNNSLSGGVEESASTSKEKPITVVAKFIVDGKEFTQTVVAPNQDVLSDYYEGR